MATKTPFSAYTCTIDGFFMAIISNLHLMGYLKAIISKLFINDHYQSQSQSQNQQQDS